MKLRWLAAVGILSAACCAIVMSQAAGQERFDLKVRNYFFAGFAGDAESLQKGISMCEEALASDPKNAQALVWHGSGMYFQAGQAFQKGDQEKGMSLYQRGMQEMDQAVVVVAIRVEPGLHPFADGCAAVAIESAVFVRAKKEKQQKVRQI